MVFKSFLMRLFTKFGCYSITSIFFCLAYLFLFQTLAHACFTTAYLNIQDGPLLVEHSPLYYNLLLYLEGAIGALLMIACATIIPNFIALIVELKRGRLFSWPVFLATWGFTGPFILALVLYLLKAKFFSRELITLGFLMPFGISIVFSFRYLLISKFKTAIFCFLSLIVSIAIFVGRSMISTFC